MTQRLNISIPEELFTRLDKVKGNFKVSKICQNAIEVAVTLEELRGSDSVDDLIQRVGREKRELSKPYYDEGFKSGVKDAKSFSYSDFIKFLKLSGADRSNTERDHDIFLEDYLCSGESIDKSNYFEQGGKLPTNDFSRVEGPYQSDFEPIAFVDGWIDGVYFIWKEIKDKI